MNSTNLFKMQWPRDLSGYEFIEFSSHTISNERSLIELPKQSYKRICPKNKNWRYYDPFTEAPELAREFSQLRVNDNEVEEDAALEFINRYGLLTMRTPENGQGETLDDWGNLIVGFRKVFKLIDTHKGKEAAITFNQANLNVKMSLEISEGNTQNKRGLNIFPATLYGAMCLMVSDEITKGVQVKQCQVPKCANWFPVRSNKKFCSNACRQAKHRKNK